MIAAGAFAGLAQALIDLHYDPAYDRAARKAEAPVLARMAVTPTDPSSRRDVAGAIAGLVRDHFRAL
ncbi:MAG: hypothetical protein Q8S47_18945 [Phenylobacterium sp.]|nr:hypothetical protein [Phenylobacterium sp.]